MAESAHGGVGQTNYPSWGTEQHLCKETGRSSVAESAHGGVGQTNYPSWWTH